MNQIAKHIIVEGKVQGVFFRKNAKKKAEELHVVGWVKNTENNTVEIIAQGEIENVNEFSEWCKQGSPKAHVTNVQIKENDLNDAFKNFSIMYKDD